MRASLLIMLLVTLLISFTLVLSTTLFRYVPYFVTKETHTLVVRLFRSLGMSCLSWLR